MWHYFFMNILITGAPHIGKSTLLVNVVEGIKSKQGFITGEVLDQGYRIGFELVSAIGDKALLASVNSSSKIRVSKYGVDIDTLDNFLESLPEPLPNDLLYLDEVGEMELYSSNFKRLVEYYLDLPNAFVGTLSSVYHDEFTDKLRERSDVEVIELDLANRDSLKNELVAKITMHLA